MAGLSVKLDELSKKAAAASEDAKVYRELRKEAINEKISTAKGNVAAMQENVRLAEEERQGKIRSALLKARMTAKAKHEDRMDARDKRLLEGFIEDEISYILDCYDAALPDRGRGAVHLGGRLRQAGVRRALRPQTRGIV